MRPPIWEFLLSEWTCHKSSKLWLATKNAPSQTSIDWANKMVIQTATCWLQKPTVSRPPSGRRIWIPHGHLRHHRLQVVLHLSIFLAPREKCVILPVVGEFLQNQQGNTHIAFSKWKLLEEDWPFKQASPVSEERRKRSIMMLGKKDKFDEPMKWGPAQT